MIQIAGWVAKYISNKVDPGSSPDYGDFSGPLEGCHVITEDIHVTCRFTRFWRYIFCLL